MWDKRAERCHGAAASQLASMMQVACTAHHAAIGEDIVLLDNSLTIWYILMMNDAFMIKEKYQHHFHLTLDLAYLF
jgi:hypothetical protein